MQEIIFFYNFTYNKIVHSNTTLNNDYEYTFTFINRQQNIILM